MNTNNSPTVVLIGFSTAGKSTFLQYALDTFAGLVQCLDSDKWITHSFDKEHIFELFMQQGRDTALQQIGTKENRFLTTFSSPQPAPTLIAAGPFIPMQPAWPFYVEKVRPFIIHLTVSPEDVYEGLLHRRQRHSTMVDSGHELFGSWDKDIMTSWNGRSYVLLPREVAIENISRSMTAVLPTYRHYEHISFPGGRHADQKVIKEEILKQLKIKQ